MSATPTLTRTPRPSVAERVAARNRVRHRSSELASRATCASRRRARHRAHRAGRAVRVGRGGRPALRQLVLLAPPDGGVDPRPRHRPAPRHLLVHCAGHEVGRTVLARRADLRRAQPRVRRVRDPRVRRPRRSRRRGARVPPRPAALPEHPAFVRDQRRRAGVRLRALVGASARARTALPPRAPVGRRGPRLARRPARDDRDTGTDVALGQRPRVVRTRVRVPRVAPRRSVGGRLTTVARTRACHRHRRGHRVPGVVHQPVRRVARPVPDRAAVTQRDPVARDRVAVP